VIALDDLVPGARVVVGCSGGADSLALLALACDAGLDVVAVYVDHGLRAGTELEARVVADAATRFGAQARVEHVTFDGRANLEARARDARYDVLERVRAEVHADAVLVGHTRDDQAETVLLNLLRGSGPAGLAGIPPVRGAIRRPLLDRRRADNRELCRLLGLTPVADPMNDALHHRRVWLRREMIPALERGARRDLVEVLARQAEVFRDDEALLGAQAAAVATDDAAAIAALPAALARRVVRQLLGSPPPSFATVERVLAVARGAAVATELPGGARIQRIGGRLVRIPADEAGEPDAPVPFAVPGRARCAGVEIEAWIEHAAPVAWPDGRWVAVCDADLVGDTVELQPGAPLPVVAGESLVWSVGYRVARNVRATARTRRYLWMSAEPQG
jgi:tRNA(Ile)-lysidine synthase